LRTIDLPDESCDAFVLNHVLDCMPGDRQAIAEMFRVLRPGGFVLAVVALQQHGDTHEVPVAANSLHRVYGTRDLAVRVAPFDLAILDAADGLSSEARRVQGIPPSVPMLLMQKPSREACA
jgi:ubiquinone/menaquinone biosynthesis C-methylase UbiE